MTPNTAQVVIPSFLLSRLAAISHKLGISQSDTIQALFNWTEVGMALAETMGIDELNPHVLFDAVHELKQAQNIPQADTQISATQEADLPNPLLDAQFDTENLKNLFTSVRLLSEAVSTQQQLLLNHRPTLAANLEPNLEANHKNSKSASKSNGFSKEIKSLEKMPVTVQGGQKVARQTAVNKTRKRDDSRRIEAERDINEAITQIMAFNNQPDLPHLEKWFIGPASLRKLTKRGSQVIQDVLNERELELTEHHHLHQLSNKHNIRGKNNTRYFEQLKSFLDNSSIR
jgi:hypothetical protein